MKSLRQLLSSEMESLNSIWGVHEPSFSLHPPKLGSHVTLSLALHTLMILGRVLVPRSFHTFFFFLPLYVFSPLFWILFPFSGILGEVLFIFYNPIQTSPPPGRLPRVVHLSIFYNTSFLYTYSYHCFATHITCFSVYHLYYQLYREYDWLYLIYFYIDTKTQQLKKQNICSQRDTSS